MPLHSNEIAEGEHPARRPVLGSDVRSECFFAVFDPAVRPRHQLVLKPVCRARRCLLPLHLLNRFLAARLAISKPLACFRTPSSTREWRPLRILQHRESYSEMVTVRRRVRGSAEEDGLEQDVFRGQGGAVADIELAAALGVADMDPGGGSTEGAVETSRVTEGIRECGTPPAAVAPARNPPHSRPCCCRPISGPDGSVATDSHRQSAPAVALHTISRF